MAVIIPNASDTTGGNKYEALDQAEPDSLDFELLGTAGSGVLTGCEVTSNNSTTHVSVQAGVVVLGGIPYTVAASSSLALPAAPADNRFDLVVARVTSGVAALVVVSGANSAINPTFPKSASVITGAPSLASNINFNTDVVLAAIYRSGASTITASRIVDKRKFVTTAIFDQGVAAPWSGYGSGPGQLYYRTGQPNGTASGVYIKTDNGTWIELAQNVGAHTPIGAAMLWPSPNPVPAGCVEANGQALSTAAYPALFAVYGYHHGGSGGTFNVPDYNGKFIRGTTTPANVGLLIGADTVTLGLNNIPNHTHDMQSHTHTFGHTHSIDHTHPASNTGQAGAHWHDVLSPGGNYGMGQLYGSGSSGSTFYAPSAQFPPTGSRNGQQMRTDNEPHHTHTTPALSFTGSTSSQSTATSGAPSVATTSGVVDQATSSSPFSNIPSSTHARWIIRASLGSDPAYTGGTPPGSTGLQTVSARNSSFTLALADEGSLITVGASGNMTITVPNLAFNVGSKIDFWLTGVATITFAAGAGVTINSEGNVLTWDTRYTAVSLIKLPTAGNWGLVGKLG